MSQAASTVDLHYIHLGEDKAAHGTVVFIGSLGTSAEMWEPQFAAVSEFFQLIAVDTRGHGASPVTAQPYSISMLADDVIAVMDKANAASAHIVGLSLGGAIAQAIALEHADRVKSLTLCSTAPKFGTREAWLDKTQLVLDKTTAAVADGAIGNWFTDECFETTPAMPATYKQMILDCPDQGYANCCLALAEFDSRERLAEITVPTLVIAGEQDTSTVLEVVHSLHEGIPGSKMATISPAKHLLNVEQSALYNAVLLAHLKENA